MLSVIDVDPHSAATGLPIGPYACTYVVMGAWNVGVLYVGRTGNWSRRRVLHAQSSPWWSEAVQVQLLHIDFPSDPLGRTAKKAHIAIEDILIKTLNPLRNGMPGRGGSKTA